MNNRRDKSWTRRQFLGTAALAGTEALWGFQCELLAAESPPETTNIRLIHRTDALCLAPQYVADELLRSEGFTDVQSVKTIGGGGIEKILASGEASLSMHFAPAWIARIEAGDPIVIIGGGHVGCYELFASSRVQAIRQLKGKAVAVSGIQSLQR